MLESLFNKFADLQVCDLIKKRLQHSCFPVYIVEFLGTIFYGTSPVTASEDRNHLIH